MSQKETLTEEARMDSPQIPLPSATFLSPGTTVDTEDEAAGDDDKSYRSRKVIKPTPAWKLRLNKWFGTSRWTYRQCVDLVKARKVKAWDLKGLRNRVVHENNYGCKGEQRCTWATQAEEARCVRKGQRGSVEARKREKADTSGRERRVEGGRGEAAGVATSVGVGNAIGDTRLCRKRF